MSPYLSAERLVYQKNILFFSKKSRGKSMGKGGLLAFFVIVMRYFLGIWFVLFGVSYGNVFLWTLVSMTPINIVLLLRSESKRKSPHPNFLTDFLCFFLKIALKWNLAIDLSLYLWYTWIQMYCSNFRAKECKKYLCGQYGGFLYKICVGLLSKLDRYGGFICIEGLHYRK